MSKKFDLVIDGGKVSARDHFEVHNPSTGEVVGLAPQASPADLDHASDAGLLHAGYVSATLLRAALGELDSAPVTELLRRALSSEASLPGAHVR